MRGVLLLVTGTALLILVSPLAGAGACISHMDLTVGQGVVRFDMQQVFAEEDAAGLRSVVDQGVGDSDGQVTDEEVAAWESAMSSADGAAVQGCLDSWSGFMGGFVRQDDRVPEALEDLRAMMDLGGSRLVTGEEPLVLRFSGLFRYDVAGPETELVVVPEAFEGISEMIECTAPERVDTNFAQNPCGDDPRDPLEAMDRLAVHPMENARIDEATIVPAVAREAYDGRSIVVVGFVSEESLPELRFRVVTSEAPGAPGGGVFPVVATVAAAAAGLAGLAGLLMAGGERVRFRFWWLFSVLGFTRIRREKALENRRRESLLAVIESEPGVHLGALQRGLGMATGTLVHHLRVLERAGLVETRRRSNRVHFVPAGHRGPIETSRSALQLRVLDLVRSVPGLSQSELADRLGEPRNTVAYNVRRLIEDDLVEVRREGREVRHYPGDDPPPGAD